MCLKTNNQSKAAKIAQQTGLKRWVLEDMKIQYSKRDNYNIYLKVIHTEIAHRSTNIEFDIFDRKVREQVNSIITKKFTTQNKKLQTLRTTNKRKIPTIEPETKHFTDHTFHKRFVNLTNSTFTEEESGLLEKGLQYNLKPKDTQKSREILGVECELALSNEDPHFKYMTANKIKKELFEQPQPRQAREQKTAVSIKTKAKENNIIFTRADKGKSVVAISREQYIFKTLSFLNTDKFQVLNNDPTKVYQKLIKSTLKDLTIFNDFEKSTLTIMNPQAPKLYSLIKLHKKDFPIRPVVSFVTAPSIKLSQKLIPLLRQHCKFKPKYSIANTYELIDKIKNINLPENSRIISFDVQNLFPSIPPYEVIELVDKLLIKNKVNEIIKRDILDLLTTCLDQNYFEFNDNFYTSKEGLIMGNPLSPLLAEIFMDHLELKIHQNAISKNIVYWYRYVDDIISCFTGTDRQLTIFLNFLNNLHPNIKFTIELETNNSINFLDISISKVNNKHDFSIFHKPSHTDTVIHNSSSHPYPHKMAAFNSFIHRLLHIPMTKTNFNKEFNIIKQIAINNGYDPNIIDNILNKKSFKQAISLIYPTINDKKGKFSTLTYTGKITRTISKHLIKKNNKIAFKTSNSLGSIILNNKTKSKKSLKSGVYLLNCGSCTKTYVGQTGRSFETRIKEHKHSYLKNKNNSHYATHIINESHNFDDTLKILHVENKSKKLNLLECLEINKRKNSNQLLNEQVDLNHSPLLNLY